MHNNYYFLRQLSSVLKSELYGFTLVSCFSQNKDELVIEFNNSKESFFLKASLTPDFQCLSFPTGFHRARKNSVDLFQDLILKKVLNVRQFNNERSFAIELEDNNALVFTLHGTRANVISFKDGVAEDIFRNNFQADLEIGMNDLDRTIDWSYENFIAHQASLQSTYFTFGKPVWTYLQTIGFETADTEKKWELVQQTLIRLEKPEYHIVDQGGVLSLSLLPSQFVAQTYADPMTAINEFFYRKISTSAFRQEKNALLSQVNGKLKQGRSYVEKNLQKLTELENDTHHSQWADLIMANLHTIKQGADSVELENFYDHQRPVVIRLKKELSPQKNAEVFYRKSKNQAIEVRTLKDSIARKENEIGKLQTLQTSLMNATEMDSIRALSESVIRQVPDKQKTLALPYHEYEFKGFKIWVGKNAEANDKLTLKYSYKEDLWLHAKDVAGSHVLVKYQAGKTFPKDVIEFAAGLAAYHSKRKNESLCPVAYTSKKYVRKRKGDPAGAVVVEREEVIMVRPQKIIH